jgi:lipopolysaccharide/colanic/teichoic acid biosynthesis glycosyltransferase
MIIEEGGAVFGVPMKREISPLHDLRSLWRIWRLLHRIRPDLTNVGTPKAGLLGGLAAVMAGVPCRIYALYGLRLETATRVKRRILMLTERIACKCAHRVICASPSLRQRSIDLGLVESEKAFVLGNGTCNGVDVVFFLPSPKVVARSEQLGKELNLPNDVPVIGFVGRFTRDKGIAELLDAYDELRCKYPALRLLLLGDFENGDPVPLSLRARIESDPLILRPGFVPDTSAYYQLMDMLVLPTWREGLPQVNIEAQAAGIPVVTTRATGAIDSVQDGKTGLLVPVGDASALARAIGSLLDDAAKRKEMGRSGQEWVTRKFAGDRVRAAQVRQYQSLIREKLGHGGRRGPQRGWRWVVKRLLDFTISAAGLAVFLPVLGMVALVIRMAMGGPVLFRQIRPGRYARPFTLLKFRTMSERRDANGDLLPDADRLTRVGRLLRASSLDELPQLWNVLRGDISLVGPRPLLMEYLPRYSPEQARRHEVMSGITGWAQINGRNELTWEEKFALDTWYVDNWSLNLDLRILLLTFKYSLRRKGIFSSGHVTMPQFTRRNNEMEK